MKFSQIRWGYALAGFLAAEVALIAAAIAWVAIYSYLINPGHPAQFYQQYGQVASPYVGLLLGAPAFFFVCRWVGFRTAPAARATALAVFGIFCLIEVPAAIAFPSPVISPWFEALNLPLKLASCLLGARASQPTA